MMRGAIAAILVCGLLPAADRPFASLTERERLEAAHAITAAEAARLEELAGRGDTEAHLRLAVYSFVNAQREQRAMHVLWLIEHHPDHPLLAESVFQIVDDDTPVDDPHAFPRARTLWDLNLARCPNCPPVLFNAAVFVQAFDPVRAERLALLGRRLEPQSERWTLFLAGLYAKALRTEGRMRPQTHFSRERSAFAAHSRQALEGSKDAVLVGWAGRALVPARPEVVAGRAPESIAFGQRLLERARALAPGDPRWIGAAAAAAGDSPDTPDAVRNRAAPHYPEEARKAGVTGTVRVRILIGVEGKVLSARAISGPPALHRAAEDAALRWVFQPVLAGGRPVETYHEVEIPFEGK